MPSFLGHPRPRIVLLPPPVYATWNPAGTNPNITLSNGNLTAEVTGPTASGAYGLAATSGYDFDEGKRYIEIHLDLFNGSSSDVSVGFADSDFDPAGAELGNSPWSFSWRADGFARNNGETTPVGVSAVQGDVAMLAIDAFRDGSLARANIWFGLNGDWFGAGSPSNATNPVFAGVVAPSATDWGVFASLRRNGDRIRANFGASQFTHSVPSGFIGGWGDV